MMDAGMNKAIRFSHDELDADVTYLPDGLVIVISTAFEGSAYFTPDQALNFSVWLTAAAMAAKQINSERPLKQKTE